MNKPTLNAGAIDPVEGIPYPRHLEIEAPYKQGVMRVPVGRFFKQEYHDLEVERIWKRTWQFACREEDIPEVGDYTIYDIVDMSFIVMRTAEDEFKAYWNSCPHRARKLREYDGRGVSEIRCMFHGFTWNIDGTLKALPCKWDFPGTEAELSKLSEAKTGRWGGFVFINPDSECESLADFLGTLPSQFEGANHDFSKRWKQVHVAAVIDANWKVVQEAFIEAWHVNTTHPQLVWSAVNRNAGGTRWDDFGNWMRSAPALPTDAQKTPPGWMIPAENEQDAVDAHYNRHRNEPPVVEAPQGSSATELIAARVREFYRGIIGDKIDEYHDVELLGGDMVHVFPNFHPWGGFSRIVYRFRPYGNDPNCAIMDVILLAPWPEDKPRPPAAPIHWLEPGQDTSHAPELGQLARIFLQDCANMTRVQEGLKASKLGYVILSNNNEAPVRHLHELYDRWMGLNESTFAEAEYGAR